MTQQTTPRTTVAARRVTVAFLGLGAMGEPMCRRFVVASDQFDVIVFDVAAVLAVRDEAQLRSSVFGNNGVMSTLRPGATIILTSTVGPDVVRDTAHRLAERDVALLDAPVSGGPGRAATGELLVMAGAANEVMARCRPVLDRRARRSRRAGRLNRRHPPIATNTRLTNQDLRLRAPNTIGKNAQWRAGGGRRRRPG